MGIHVHDVPGHDVRRCVRTRTDGATEAASVGSRAGASASGALVGFVPLGLLVFAMLQPSKCR